MSLLLRFSWGGLALVILVSASPPARAGGVGITVFEALSDSLPPAYDTAIQFNPHRVPENRSLPAFRDLEFHWSGTYTTRLGRYLVHPDSTNDNELDRLGDAVCKTNSNPFGFALPDIWLVTNMLTIPLPGRPRVGYSPDTQFPGFLVREPYDTNNRRHLDVYVFRPGTSGNPSAANYDPVYGQQRGDDSTGASADAKFPSDFAYAAEDLDTGRPANVDSILHNNSIQFGGPIPGRIGVFNSVSWSDVDQGVGSTLIHEFQHCLNEPPGGPSAIREMFGMAAEALAGAPGGKGRYDVPYTRSLLMHDQGRNIRNYEAWRSFTSYLAYNFRGVDQTVSGIGDDVLARWAAATNDAPFLSTLGSQLSNATCLECVPLIYFTGLSTHDRLQVLIHNWRVANYVNDTSIAQGQYGFPSRFRFSPTEDIGNWQDLDPTPQASNCNVIPPEVTVARPQFLSEMVLTDVRDRGTLDTCKSLMSLAPLGAEYWVIKSHPELASTNQSLTIRVQPRGILCLACHGRNYNGRVLVSAIAYTQQTDTLNTLWRHPEWAAEVFGPQWTDVGSNMGGSVEVVVPGFGSTYKAVVAVITLGDGSQGGLSTASGLSGAPAGPVLPYALGLSLCAPAASVDLVPAAEPAVSPTWSPAGDEVAYQSPSPGGTLAKIYRRKLDGSPPTLVDPAVPSSYIQYAPDWSPRGDWVVYSQDAGNGLFDLWVHNVVDHSTRVLVASSDGDELNAAFSPNGQQVVYWKATASGFWQLRRVDLSGLNNVLLTNLSLVPVYPRWSPDGQWIYFARNDSLLAVSAVNGGNPVLQRTRLHGIGRFDFHRGQGPIAYQETIANCGLCPTNEQIAVRDTLRDVSIERFVRPSIWSESPRWSFDGTRIAFSAGPQASGDRDIYYGAIGCNQAPVFNGLTDVVTDPGVPVVINLSATDADGEAVTYQDVPRYRPPGATFNSQGQFRWNDPQPPGAQHYVVFRALDPSGGLANRVVKISVVEGSCPFLDTRTASGWATENSLLNRSLSNTMTLDAYRLKLSPQVLNGRYQLRLRENEQEFTSLDQVRLVSVDHASDIRAWPNGERVVLGTRTVPYRVTTRAGAEITGLVDGSGTGYFIGQPGETLLVELVNPDSGATRASEPPTSGDLDPFEIDDGGKNPGGGGLVATQPEGQVPSLDAAILRSTGILIQGRDAGGVWRTVRQRYPREHFDDFIVDTLDQGPIRLVFVGRHKLRFVGRVAPIASVEPQAVPLLTATHSRVGDVRLALLDADGVTAALTPGDTIALDFSASSVPAGKVRDFFLLSKGLYSSVRPESHESVAATLPIRFALLQNQPNPFARTTSIRFDVPRPEHVRLDVFDLQGRLVRHLADAPYEPGRWSVEWDRRGASGGSAPAGIYLYRLIAGSFRLERKMALLP